MIQENNTEEKTSPSLIAVVGPTSSGKTDLAADLARRFQGEIINADSRQIYKEINIASAKPRLMRLPQSPLLNKEGAGALSFYKGIPHHLFDIVNPDKEFNVTHFKTLAIQTINDIHQRGKLPFLVGGTGLWIRAVVDNLDIPNVPPNPELRRKFELAYAHPTRHSRESGNPENKTNRRIDFGLLLSGSRIKSGVTNGTHQLYQQLITLDPAAASFVNPKNPRRIIRALEVIYATGKPFSEQRRKRPPLFRTLQLGYTRPIDELENRIAARLKAQIKEGLEQEARKLFSKYNPNLPALSSICLIEWKAYFDGAQSYDETLNLIRLHNRQYAKRQMTWFKRDKRIRWVKNKDEAASLIKQFLQGNNVTI